MRHAFGHTVIKSSWMNAIHDILFLANNYPIDHHLFDNCYLLPHPPKLQVDLFIYSSNQVISFRSQAVLESSMRKDKVIIIRNQKSGTWKRISSLEQCELKLRTVSVEFKGNLSSRLVRLGKKKKSHKIP